MKSKTIWMFHELGSEFKEVKEGDKVEIQIMRTGEWQHPLYGKVKVDDKVLDDVVKNYSEDKRGIRLAIDENHEPNHKALGWIDGLTRKAKDSLFATIELTKMGADLISQGAYKYFSPEIIFNKRDEETGEVIKNLLIGGAFTNRPFFKAMQPLMANEEMSQGGEDINKNILFFNTNASMNTILELLAKFTEGGLSIEEKTLLKQKFSELSEEDKTEELTNAINDATTEEKEKEKEEEKKEEFSEKEKEKQKFKAEDEVSIKMSELDELKSQAALAKKLIEEQRKNEFSSKVNGFVFSETNSKGVILPKMSQDLVDFTLGLDNKQAEKFFEILSNVQNVATGEIGHSGQAFAEYSEEVVNFYKEKMGMSEEEAIEVAKIVAKEKGMK